MTDFPQIIIEPENGGYSVCFPDNEHTTWKATLSDALRCANENESFFKDINGQPAQIIVTS